PRRLPREPRRLPREPGPQRRAPAAFQQQVASGVCGAESGQSGRAGAASPPGAAAGTRGSLRRVRGTREVAARPGRPHSSGPGAARVPAGGRARGDPAAGGSAWPPSCLLPGGGAGGPGPGPRSAGAGACDPGAPALRVGRALGVSFELRLEEEAGQTPEKGPRAEAGGRPCGKEAVGAGGGGSLEGAGRLCLGKWHERAATLALLTARLPAGRPSGPPGTACLLPRQARAEALQHGAGLPAGRQVPHVRLQPALLAGRLRHPRRGHLAGGHTGELRHTVFLLPVAVGCQPAHRHWRLRDGHRLRGLHRGHQGEQMPPAHRESSGGAGWAGGGPDGHRRTGTHTPTCVPGRAPPTGIGPVFCETICSRTPSQLLSQPSQPPRTRCGVGRAIGAGQVGHAAVAEAGGPGPQFFVALLLVFLLEACITILFFAYTDKIDKYAQRDLKKGLHLYGTPGNVGLTNAWSIIQTDFRCCGVSNYTDWFEVYNATRVPDSCCLEFSESCGLHAPGTWWKAPCYETVKMWLQENLLAVGVFGLCTALVQILGLTFAMTMYCQVVRADTYCA
uniref:Tetraspanin-4 n=1 Tax=Moschus moschiferus TaxID=68415 RepID=A0A8C6FHV1_MOSMO